jgi:hypothetical protein
MPVSACHARVDHQTVPVIGQRMAHVSQFAARLAFPVEPRIRIGTGLMRLVAALATFKVARAAAFVILIVIVLANEDGMDASLPDR